VEHEQLAVEDIPEPDFFDVVNILYVELRLGDLRIRGIQPVRCGVVAEEHLDLCLSVEMAAKSVLSVREFAMWQVFSFHNAADKLPNSIKAILNQAFEVIYYTFSQLRTNSERASSVERARLARQAAKSARALDQGFEGYSEDEVERARIEAEELFK
jgi:hypothetical protein